MIVEVLLLATATILLYALDSRKWKVLPEVPVPETIPFLGSAHLLLGNATEFFSIVNQGWHEFGRRMRIFMGPIVILMTSDPKDIEVVLTSPDFMEKSNEYSFLYPWLGNGLLTSKGDKWRIHRKLTTQAFHFKILESFVETINKHTETLIDILKTHADGVPINVYPFCTTYALDNIMETSMGKSINIQRNPDSEYIRAVEVVCGNYTNRLKSLWWRSDFIFSFSQAYRAQQWALKTLNAFAEVVIHNRLKALEDSQETMETYLSEEDCLGIKKQMALLDVLLLTKINGKPMDHQDIKDEANTFLFAGHDTTASSLSFMLNQISKHSDVQKKLFEEQMAIFSDDLKRKSTYRDIQNMKYMDMVVKEVMRMFPIVPLLGRKSSKDTKINDLYVPKNTPIALMVYNLHKDPKIYPEPEQFIPERFLPEECAKRNPFSFIPFSGGSRNCIAQKYAVMQIKLCLSQVIRKFELFPSSENLELMGEVTLKSHNGVFVGFKVRQHNVS